jgi:hypothetical protein
MGLVLTRAASPKAQPTKPNCWTTGGGGAVCARAGATCPTTEAPLRIEGARIEKIRIVS